MIEQIASAFGEKEQKRNIELAVLLCETENHKGITEIVDGLNDKKAVANDCIKVLYEIGYRKPDLIKEYTDVFIKLLDKRNNRLVWGGMTALSTVASLKPKIIEKEIDKIIYAYNNGSVITVDASIVVFTAIVSADVEISDQIFLLLIRHLENCRPKEVGQHAEKIYQCINRKNVNSYKQVLEKRYDILSASQQKRVKKLLTKVNKKFDVID
jgi:hypothetical protein